MNEKAYSSSILVASGVLPVDGPGFQGLPHELCLVKDETNWVLGWLPSLDMKVINNNSFLKMMLPSVCCVRAYSVVNMGWKEWGVWEDFKALAQRRNVFSCCPLANDLFPSCPLQLFPFLWVSGSCSLSVVFVRGTTRSPVCEKVHVVCFIHIQELSRDKQFKRQSSENWNARGVFVFGPGQDLAAVFTGADASHRWAAAIVPTDMVGFGRMGLGGFLWGSSFA